MRKRFVRWILGSGPAKFIFLKVLPYIRFTTYYANFPGVKYHEGYKILEMADIILTVDKLKLTTKLVPGTMTHATFCVGNRAKNNVLVRWVDYGQEIVEMTHENFHKIDFFDVCKESTRIVIMRNPRLTVMNRWKIAMVSRKFWNAHYDTVFTLGEKLLYCSELDYHIFKDAGFPLKVKLDDVAAIGTKYISPDGLMFAEDLVCVYDSDYDFTDLTGPQIRKLLGR